MKKQKNLSYSNATSFWLFNIALILFFIASLCFSLFNKTICFISWPENYIDVIGVSSQIITAISTLIVSVISISISLQNDDYFGIKVSTLYSLRVEKRYSILQIVIISIILCVINLVTYMCTLSLAAIATSIISIIFSIKVACVEIPLMVKDEKRMLKILKNKLIYNYVKKEEASIYLKSAVKHLICYKNLQYAYNELKTDNNSYNLHLLMKLLEYQHDIAFELEQMEDSDKLRKITGSLLNNVFDVILNHLSLPDEFHDDIIKNKYLLTRVLFRLIEIPISKQQTSSKIGGLFQLLSFTNNLSQKVELLCSSIIIILAAGTIKKEEFCIVRELRLILSQSSWGLKKECAALNVFAIISMHLYYLCKSEPQAPNSLKESISIFINESNIIERNTKITSWKSSFTSISNEFKIKYGAFIMLSMYNIDVMEYWLYSNRAHTMVFDFGYITKWYLTNLFNSRQIKDFDFSSLITENPDSKYYLTSFYDECFDDNKNFQPSENMKNIVNFYCTDRAPFSLFDMMEKHSHRFFEFINQIRLSELQLDVRQTKELDNSILSDRIKVSIENALKSEWGFDPSLSISNTERYFSVIIEKYPELFEYDDSIIDFCKRSVFDDISKHCKRSKIYKDNNFNNKIKEVLSKKLKFATSGAKSIIPHYFLDENLKQLYLNVCNPLVEFSSNLLYEEALIVEDGFMFNCVLDKVEVRTLNEEELAQQVNEYQRSDGQYVFRGAFLPQEEIIKIIKNKFIVITVIMRHQILSSTDTIFEINPYFAGPLDEEN